MRSSIVDDTRPTNNKDFLVPIIRTWLMFGSVGAILAISLFLLLAVMDQNPLNKGKYFDFILVVLVVFVSIRYFRDYEMNGKIKFVEGLAVGLGTSLVLGLFTGGFLALYLSEIDPQVLEQFKQSGQQYLLQNRTEVLEDIDQETYDKTLAELKAITVADVTMDDILRKLIIGLFLTTILSVFLRR